MTLDEFVDWFNYEGTDKKGELDEETLEALKDIIGRLMEKHVDDLEDIPEFEFVDKTGKIRLK